MSFARLLPHHNLTKLPTQSGQNCLVNTSDFGFCTDASFFEGNDNQETGPLLTTQSTLLWWRTCLCWRHDTITVAHKIYVDVAYAQAEHEVWSNHSIL